MRVLSGLRVAAVYPTHAGPLQTPGGFGLQGSSAWQIHARLEGGCAVIEMTRATDPQSEPTTKVVDLGQAGLAEAVAPLLERSSWHIDHAQALDEPAGLIWTLTTSEGGVQASTQWRTGEFSTCHHHGLNINEYAQWFGFPLGDLTERGAA